MMNQNSKSLKSSIPRLTTDVIPASYCILSIGQVMRELMKKHPGSSLPSSDMLPNLLWTSTLHIQPSLALFQVFDSGTFHFNFEVLLKFSIFLQVKSNSYYKSTLLPYSRVPILIFTGPQSPIQALGYPLQIPILLP